MSSVAALNKPLRCTRELTEFDSAMGWVFHDLSLAHDADPNDEIAVAHGALKRREHTHTAMDEKVAIPHEFVGPESRSKLKSSHHKSSSSTVHSAAAYSKRPTAVDDPPLQTQKKKQATASPSNRKAKSPPKVKDQDGVDFVYDTSIRRKLRQRIDAGRYETRHRAVERENLLRSEHKWVGGSSQATIERKQAWQTDTNTGTANNPSPSQLPPWSPVSAPSAPPQPMSATEKSLHTRAVSAGSSRSSAKTARATTQSKKKAVSAKTAVAPNVSDWRTQTNAYHPCAETDHARWRAGEIHRKREQQRAAHEVESTIDEFEQRMKQQWSIKDQ